MSENCILPDSMTSNYFFEILEYEFSRAVRYKNVVTLMFIKLCRLDEIVGSSGQNNAESIMAEIERIIRSNIRNTDRQFMYGKDEFMIILPNTPKQGASNIIPKLQRLIENYRFSSGGGKSIGLTPRFGLATYPDQEDYSVDQAVSTTQSRARASHSIINISRCNTAL